jgi:sporulation protein YlmC with PRC-barrel domain
MPNHQVSDFHPGARVESSDGKHVGSLHRLVLDHQTWDLKEIIVRETERFSGRLFAPGSGLMDADVIVPISSVASATHDQVNLAAAAAEVRRMAPYLAYGYAAAQPGDTLRVLAAQTGLTGYWPYAEAARKTSGELEIDADENVMLGHTGKRLGRVRDVLYDGRELVGVVIHPDGWWQHDVVLQVRFLDRSDDLALFATLSDKDIESMPPFSPETAEPDDPR